MAIEFLNIVKEIRLGCMRDKYRVKQMKRAQIPPKEMVGTEPNTENE
jgi:hypothetical protein